MGWQEELNAKRLKTKGWYGCVAPDGWQKIIEDTDNMLAYIDPDYEIHQIKEKFGTLRYYFGTTKTGFDREIMYTIASNAEYRSGNLCEQCAGFGELRKSGNWLKTLCDECASELGYVLVNEVEEGE